MGWDGVYTSNTIKEQFLHDFVGKDSWAKCLGYSFKGNTCYAVFEHTTTTDGWAAGARFGAVILYQKSKGMVYHKFMDWTMGPCESKLPRKLYDLLADTPAEGFAKDWMERCKANLEKPEPKLTPGVKFKVQYYGPHLEAGVLEVVNLKKHLFKVYREGMVPYLTKLVGFKRTCIKEFV